MVCGYLDPDVRRIADELLMAESAVKPEPRVEARGGQGKRKRKEPRVEQWDDVVAPELEPEQAVEPPEAEFGAESPRISRRKSGRCPATRRGPGEAGSRPTAAPSSSRRRRRRAGHRGAGGGRRLRLEPRGRIAGLGLRRRPGGLLRSHLSARPIPRRAPASRRSALAEVNRIAVDLRQAADVVHVLVEVGDLDDRGPPRAARSARRCSRGRAAASTR